MSIDSSLAVLLDTHAILWWQAESPLLSKAARKRIESASMRFVSPLSFWEVSMLVEKGRIKLDRKSAVWASDFLATERVTLIPLTPIVAMSAAQLTDFHGDPADRMIVATAIAEAVPLVTKDEKIRAWARSSKQLVTVW